MALKLITPATELPVSLDEAKAHLRVDGTDDDLLITAYLGAAVRMAEQATVRALMTQTWLLSLDAFPSVLELTRTPVVSITSLVYDDITGTPQTWANTNYTLNNADYYDVAKITPAFGKAWPAIRNQVNAVRVTYVAGFTNAAAVPENIKSWIKLAVGSMYENRAAEVLEKGAVLTLGFADRLLDSDKVWKL